MSAGFVDIDPYQDLKDNAFKAIADDWMLITAGTPDSFNTMTASWGTLGELWGRPVCFCFIRPQRHTYGFMERATHFTLSFYDVAYRTALDFCGNHSGRDVDKVAETGLTAVTGATGAIYFAEARLVFECRKIYAQDIAPEKFLDPSIPAEVYPTHDYHRMYVGEVLHCLVPRQD